MIKRLNRLPAYWKWLLLLLVIIASLTFVILDTRFNLFSNWIITPQSPVKDTVELAIKVFALLFGGGLITAVARSLIERKRPVDDERLRMEVIENVDEVLPKVFKAKNPARKGDKQLQDCEISHRVSREGSTTTTDDILTALRRSRYLLIYGPTGAGKTREAAEAARELIKENWSVLLYQGDGWIGCPQSWPNGWPKGSGIKIILFIDDMHKYCMIDYQQPSDKGKDTPLLKPPPFQHRLERLMDFMEKSLNPERFRVIATSRSEGDYWDSLGLKEHVRFWHRFELYELRPLTHEALAKLFLECVTELELSLSSNDPIDFIERTDGMPLTIVIRVTIAGKKKSVITPDDMSGPGDRTWADVYYACARNQKKYPFLPHIYDAANILLQAQLPLEMNLIIMWINEHIDEPFWKKLIVARKVRKTLSNLAREHSWWKLEADGTVWVRPEALSGKPDLATL